MQDHFSECPCAKSRAFIHKCNASRRSMKG
jgi:hypothetical protein